MYKIIKHEVQIADGNEAEITVTIVAHNISTYKIALEISESYEKMEANDRSLYLVDKQEELIRSEIIDPFDDELPF